MPLTMAAGHNNTIGHRPKLLVLSTNSDLASSPLPVGTPLEHIKSDEQATRTRYPHAESWGSMGSGEALVGTKT